MTVTRCPTCGIECAVASDKEGTNHYLPIFNRNPMLDELRTLLSARPGEPVVEAAKRWRETVEWYGDLKNWTAPVDPNNISESILNGEIATENDLGQRARELLGEVKE